MKNTVIRKILLLAPLAIVSAEVAAYKLNPCMRILTLLEAGPSQRKINPWNPCDAAPDGLQQAVHEHMTLASIYKYRGVPFPRRAAQGSENAAVNYMTEQAWRIGTGRKHDTYALVFGTWWNDDPLMYLWAESNDFIRGVYYFHQLFSKPLRSTYAGAIANCQVPREEHLGWASHFGTLQHLHFMTSAENTISDEEKVKLTVYDALSWIEFAYSVAAGSRNPESPFTKTEEISLRMPSIAINLCLLDPGNVKVRSIFTRQGPNTAENLRFRNNLTPDVALGSILHLFQDSFSPAHACRVKTHIDGKPFAALRKVFNYNDQTSDEHSALDGYPEWLLDYHRSGTHRYSNDPVAVGAWLLLAVDNKLPWEQVRKHLESTIFMTEPTHNPTLDADCI